MFQKPALSTSLTDRCYLCVSEAGIVDITNRQVLLCVSEAGVGGGSPAGGSGRAAGPRSSLPAPPRLHHARG